MGGRPWRALFSERTDTPALRSNLSATLLTQLAVGVGGLLLYRLLALDRGAHGVAGYALVKQIVVFVAPTVMLGLATAIPRYVALSQTSKQTPERYLLAGTLVTGFTTLLVGAVALVAPRTTASLLLGSADRSDLVLPLVVTLAASVAFDVTAGYLRGRFRFRIWGLLTVGGVAAFPVAVVLVAPGASLGTLILLMALGMLVPSAVVASWPVARELRSFAPRKTREAARTLLTFGYRRVPGELAAIGLFTLPPVVAAHFEPLSRVAYLTVGLYVVAVVSIAFQPIGLVLLPFLSRLCASDFELARRHVARLCGCALHVAFFVTPPLVLFADVAARAWLGSAFEHAGPIIRITTAPLVLFMVHLLLRTSLDAAALKAYNSRNNLIALTVLAATSAGFLALTSIEPLTAIAWSFAVALLTLGALTFGTVQRLFRVPAASFALRTAVPLALAAAGAGFALRAAISGSETSPVSLVLIVVLELALAAGYVAGLVRAGVPWPAEVWTRLVRRTT